MGGISIRQCWLSCWRRRSEDAMMSTCRYRWSARAQVCSQSPGEPCSMPAFWASAPNVAFFFFLKLWGSELLGKLLFLYLLSLPTGVTFIPQVLILPGVARKLPPIPPGSGHGCRPLLGQGGGCPPPGAACLALMWHTWVMSWLQAVEPWPEGSFLSASSSTEIGLSMSMWGFRSHKSLL